MNVTKPRPVNSPPKRLRLADRHAQQATIAAEIATLRPSQAEREAAASALPGAEQALKNLLFENELNPVDRTALATARGRVLELRAALAGKPDVAARIASLHAESARIGEKITAAAEDVVLGELNGLIASFQHHAKMAQIAAAGINGLRQGAVDQGRQRIADATTNALELHRDPAEAALRKLTLDGALANVRADWSRFPAALASDPEARPEPLEAAIAMLPVRDEEREGERHDAA